MRVMLEILPDRALKGGWSIVCADTIPDNKSHQQATCADIRQAHDLLSAFSFNAGGYP